MKIDQGTPPSHLLKPTETSSPEKESEKTATVTGASKTSGTDQSWMRDKMLQWFSRAGITYRSEPSLKQDISKKVSRHQYVKAQRRMKNLERILQLATDFSLDSGIKEDIDPDWFFSFVDMAEDIHSPAMQELWGKIFAVEIGQPGTFSLKTLKTLKDLTHRDAKILRIAVNLSSRKKSEHDLKILLGYHRKPNVLSLFGLPQQYQINLAAYGLTYPHLLALMDLGLIYNAEIETSELTFDSRTQYRCAGQTLHLAPKRRGLSLTYYKFTSIGVELSRLVPGKGHPNYLQDLRVILSKDFEVN